MTASPAFMSLVPHPYSRCTPSTSRSSEGRLSAIGTVSRCPASTTRVGRSSVVRASTVSPTRSTSRPPRPRSAASTASASGPSPPDTDGASTSARVSARTSVERSSFGRSVTTAEPRRTLLLPAGRMLPAGPCRRAAPAGHTARASLGTRPDRPASAMAALGSVLPVTAVPSAVPVSASAAGLATVTASGTVLDTWYPEPRLGAPEGARPGTTRLGALELSGELGPDYGGLVRRDEARGVEIIAVRTVIPDLSRPPVDTHDVWLRLHLLSHRLIQPHGANMTGIFGLLANVAWASAGP